MTSPHNKYHVEISESIDLSWLEPSWQNLEAQNSRLSFFHSWQWLKCWLDTYKPDALLVSAEFEGAIVALGIFGKHRERRHKVLSSNQLRLFQTGDSHEDQIWVEFNDLLCHPDHTNEARKACLDALLASQYGVEEIVISMMFKSRAQELKKDFPGIVTSISAPSYRTDLQALSTSNTSYLDSVNRNTRYQINRSIRRYKDIYGELKLSFAETTDQALTYWDETGPLHTSRWQDSGFHNPGFTEFHQGFIRENFDSKTIDVIKITAGNHLVAIIYNILYRDKVYFYLQGLQPEPDGKLKPGLTAHSMLIEHYLRIGMKSYDFMGGDSQYKRQLSKHTDDLQVIKIQKPLFKFRAERFAHRIKRKLLRMSQAS